MIMLVKKRVKPCLHVIIFLLMSTQWPFPITCPAGRLDRIFCSNSLLAPSNASRPGLVMQVVSALGSSSASLLGSLSNQYLHLPVLTVGASAARSEGRNSAEIDTEGEGGFLLSVHADIYPQMEALVRLILDMKVQRDSGSGR